MGMTELSYQQALEHVHVPLSDAELDEMRELSDWAMNRSGRRPKRDWIDAARLLITIDAAYARIAALEAEIERLREAADTVISESRTYNADHVLYPNAWEWSWVSTRALQKLDAALAATQPEPRRAKWDT